MCAFLMIVLLATSPTTPKEWFDRGVELHDAKAYREARSALERAAELKHPAPIVLPLRLARVSARLGDKDAAFDYLRTAIARGFSGSEALNAENDFLSLREDARWTALFQLAEKNQHPCRESPEYRQLDFWLGEWTVEQGGAQSGRSSIRVELDDCVIEENFESGSYRGRSLSNWNKETNRWEQYYTDSSGGARFWYGKREGDAMVMLTEFERMGARVMNRMTYSKAGADEVRQLIELSLDGGKTWAPAFDGRYVRRK